MKTDLDEAKDELKVLKRDYQEVHEFKSKNDGLLKEIGTIEFSCYCKSTRKQRLGVLKSQLDSSLHSDYRDILQFYLTYSSPNSL